MSDASTILVVDDEPAIREALRMILEYEGFRVVDAPDGEEALRRARTVPPHAILLDVKLPKLSGMDVLKSLRGGITDAPVLMISGHGTISTAVEALALGAQDFLEKPLEREVVLHRLRLALERSKLAIDAALRSADEEGRYLLVGTSGPLQKVRELIARAGPVNATVLITGESGTGKELVARAIHSASARSGGPFVKVNCAAIPDELIESELFGYEKGAFTGAAARQRGRFANAHGGTIFLDEIGDMSLKTQAKVLRALQDGEIEPLGAGGPIRVDVRVVAATNKDLRVAIKNGEFREDLYYRLSVLPIHLPPLRDRRDDIPALVDHVAALICRENNLRSRRFTPAALEVLRNRPWPGNVRELRNAIERAIILSSGDQIDVSALPDAENQAPDSSADWLEVESLREFKDASERQFLLRKLERHGWNITRTAQAIGTPRSNLYKKLEHHDLARIAHQRSREIL
ncbi:MAG: sigma-54 dependent transcriptional regulator [Acidobacteriota bacterium]